MRTENNAVAYSLKNKCLNFFSHVGGMISTLVEESHMIWKKAYKEDPKTATQLLLYSRGARKGSGLKRVYDHVLTSFNPLFVARNFNILVNNGCAKDIFKYLNYHLSNGGINMYPVIQVISSKLRMIPELKVLNEVARLNDKFGNSFDDIRMDLLLKWFPRKGIIFNLIRDDLGITNAELRKKLSSYTSVETLMSAKQWDKIDFNTVPGGAMRKYKKAFKTHCNGNLQKWIDDKNSKACVSATYPHEVVKLIHNNYAYNDEQVKDVEDTIKYAQKLWDSLPNYISDKERPIVMVDTSGSMEGDPMLISKSLGIYCAEKLSGKFHNKFITFSETPVIHSFENNMDLAQKYSSMTMLNAWNTDFQAAYQLLVDSAKMWAVPKNEMPTMIICISDMQFDEANGHQSRGQYNTDNVLHHELMKDVFEDAGYKFPKLVYWNVRASLTEASPANDVSEDTALISGFNPSVIEPVLQGDSFNPMKVMYESIKHIKLDFKDMPLVDNIHET